VVQLGERMQERREGVDALRRLVGETKNCLPEN